jgi:phage terminase large subunit
MARLMSDGQAITLDVTPLAIKTVEALADDSVRYIVHEGGTRSSKTQSIAQALCVAAVRRAVEIDICRESMPVLRRSAMGDTIGWLEDLGVYSEEAHNKTHEVVSVPGGSAASTLRFYGADERKKLEGPERDIQWINEANEISAGIFREIRRRTRETIVMDYNPSHGRSHWIDDLVIGSGRERVFNSTYRDNPFLPEAQVEDIEADVPVYREADGTIVIDWTLTYEGDGVLIAGDPAEWAVYGLGKRAKSDRIIFPHWTIIERPPSLDQCEDRAFGLDFGWNAPCVLVDCRWQDVIREDVNLTWHEVFRDTKLRNGDLIDELERHDVPKDVPIWCDDEPDRIEALKDAGFDARPAKKSDYKATVRTVKDHRLVVTRSSGKLQEEMEGLQWNTDADGDILDEPVKKADHGPDAGRYGTHSQKNRDKTSGGGGLHSSRDGADSHPGVSLRR